MQSLVCQCDEGFIKLFQGVEDMLFLLDSTGNILEANPSAIRTLGYSLAEMKCMDIVAISPPDRRAEVSLLHQCMLVGKCSRYKISLMTKTDVIIPVVVSAFTATYQGRDVVVRVCHPDEEAQRTSYTPNIDSHRMLMGDGDASILANHLMTMLNYLPFMAWLKDAEGRFIAVNKPFEDACGKKLETFIGKTDLAVWPREIALAYMADDEEVIRSKNHKLLEERGLDTVGGIWLETFKTPVFDHHGNVIGTTGIARDITERKMLEIFSRESALRMSLSTDSAQIGLWDWQVQTGAVIFNEQWANIVGYTLEELEPVSLDTWVRLTHPEDLAKSNQLLEECFSRKLDQYECEARMHHKNGSWVWILDRGQVVEWDSNYKPVRMVGTHINITEIKHVEEELGKKDRILTAVALSIKELLENMDYYDAVIKCFDLLGKAADVDRVYLFENIIDAEGVEKTSQKIEWNSGDFGAQIDNEHLQDIPFDDIRDFIEVIRSKNTFYGVVREIEDANVRALLEEQGILSIVILPVYVKDVFWGFVGFDECKYERRWSHVEFSTLSAFVNSLERAIERSVIEAELASSKRLAENANIAKSQFLAKMSHEIRTPFNGILGIIELMSKTSLTHQQGEYLEILKKSSESLLNIINDILDISKIEAGKMALVAIPFRLRELVDALVEITSATLKDKGLSLEAHVAESVPELLVGDAEKLKQILLNLLSNAVKFTQLGRVSMAISCDGGAGAEVMIRFCIRDTGIGIPKGKLSDISSPFIQADDSISRQYGGTGLGLAICSELIKLMGGEMAIDSEEGVGTEISFAVPFQLAAEELMLKDQAKAIQTSVLKNLPRSRRAVQSLHVLVVEDNEVNQMLTCKTLESLGCTYRLAASGEEALTYFKQEPYDLILMDIQMPGMSGLEATTKIRELEKKTDCHTPIAALTAHAMVGDRETCLAAGMDFYLSKPLYSERLISLFNAIFEFDSGAAVPDVAPSENPLHLDLEAVYRKMNGDLAFFKSFTAKFKVNSDKMLADMLDAIAVGDANRLRSVVHAFKGNLMIFEVPELLTQLKALENAGEEAINGKGNGNVQTVLVAFSVLVKQLISEMENFLRGQVASEIAKKGRWI